MMFSSPEGAALRGNKKTAQGRMEGKPAACLPAHSFVLGLDGFEQSMKLYVRIIAEAGRKCNPLKNT